MSERKEGRGKGKGKKKDRGSGKKPAPAPDVQSPGECEVLGLRWTPARVRRFSFARPRPALGMPGPAPGRPRGRTVLALRGDALYLGAQPHPGARTPRAVHGAVAPARTLLGYRTSRARRYGFLRARLPSAREQNAE